MLVKRQHSASQNMFGYAPQDWGDALETIGKCLVYVVKQEKMLYFERLE